MHETLYPFALIALIGVIFKRLYGNTELIKHSINVVVINVFLPALCIKTFARISLDREMLLVPVFAWLIILFSLTIGIFLSFLTQRLARIDKKDLGILIISSSFGNVLFIGVPVLNALYGSESIKYALLFDYFATSLIIWTLGVFILTYYSDKNSFSIKSSIKTILSLPPLWGIAIGLLLNLTGISLDNYIIESLDLLSKTVTPLMIFSVGLSLTLPNLKNILILLPFIITKLLLSPFFAIMITALFDFDASAKKAVIMESAMPVLLLLLIIVNRYKLNEQLTALAITISTVLSFFTLPFWAKVIEVYVK
ncbi:MAG TPA: AEC family transporter [Nitrospirae bacterium]|nr:AEC family transporter [Nitrospirota bacterium]